MPLLAGTVLHSATPPGGIVCGGCVVGEPASVVVVFSAGGWHSTGGGREATQSACNDT